MKIKLLENYIVEQNRVISVSKETSYQSFSSGSILKKRTYKLIDDDHFFNPQVATSLFGSIDYFGGAVHEYNDIGTQVFEGEIISVSHVKDNEYIYCLIEAAESLRALLGVIVEDTTDDATYQVDGVHAAGNNTVQLKTGTVTISVPALCAFSTSLIPRYQINSKLPASGATKTIILDRPLEKDLTNNDYLRLRSQKLDTIPNLIKNALLAYVPAAKILGGFDSLHTSENTAGHKLYVNVRLENNISLAQHIDNLLKLGFYDLLTYEDGTFDLAERAYSTGQTITENLQTAEIIAPYNYGDIKDELIDGYDCMYLSGNEAYLESDDAVVIHDVKRFQPISNTALNITAQQYLYNSQATAAYYGDKILNYYQSPKKIVVLNALGTDFIDQDIPINLSRGKKVFLTLVENQKGIFIKEPAIVLASTYSEKDKLWSNVKLELINNPYPEVAI